MSAASNWAAALDAKKIASEGSIRHVQSVIEDAKRHIITLESQRGELLTVLEDIYRELAWDQLPPAKRYLADNARAAIAKVKDGAT